MFYSLMQLLLSITSTHNKTTYETLANQKPEFHKSVLFSVDK